jgi:hypothetical protein
MLIAEVVPNDLFGLPAHPLLVHVPVVLVPLATIGALVALFVPRWRSWLLPVTAIGATIGIVGVQLAMWSGENLQADGEEGALVERHIQLADQTRPLVALFFVAAVAVAVVAWLAQRRSVADGPGTPRRPSTLARLVVPLCALSVLTGVVATVWITQAGHAGSKSVWHDKSGGGEGRSGGDGDADAN